MNWGANPFAESVNTRALRLQMLAALPRGPLVDEAMRQTMSNDVLNNVASDAWRLGVLRTHLSASGVLRIMGGLQHPLLFVIQVGLQDPDAIAAVFDQHADVLSAFGVLLNPRSVACPDTVRAAWDLVSSGRAAQGCFGFMPEPWWGVLAVALPNAAACIDAWAKAVGRLDDHSRTHLGACAASLWPLSCCGIPKGLLPRETLDAWRRETTVSYRLSQAFLRQHAPSTKDPDEARELVQAEPGLADLMLARDDLETTVAEALLDEGLHDPQLGGLAHANGWLHPAVMASGSSRWRELLLPRLGPMTGHGPFRAQVEEPAVKPVAGRWLGKELFKITDQDPALWCTAVDWLEDWDGSIPEWLKTVASLVH